MTQPGRIQQRMPISSCGNVTVQFNGVKRERLFEVMLTRDRHAAANSLVNVLLPSVPKLDSNQRR
jgi:hypothetical protein